MSKFFPERIEVRFEHELLVILGLSVPLILTIYLIRISALRILIGAPYVLFFPGYTLVAALFPGKDDLEGIERLGLSLGLSIAVLPLMGLLLNYTPFGITLLTTLISTTSFMLGATADAYYRRGKLAPEERFVVCFDLNVAKWRGSGLLDRSLAAALAVSMVLALGTFLFVLAKPEVGERFTEFYILDAKGRTEEYRRAVLSGEQMTLMVGVVNHEHEEVQYRLERDVNGRQAEEIAQVKLAHEEKWEEHYRFSLLETGEDQKISFLLYKDGQKEPYRSVHLWIDVLPRGVPSISPSPTAPAAAPPVVPTSTPAMPATAEASPSIVATAAATSTPTPSPTPSPTSAATAVPTSTPTVSPTPEVATTPQGRTIHIVQPGETVDSIARLYGVTRDAIVYVNGLEDPGLIYVGQELIIPGPDEVLPTPTPAPQ